MFGLVVLLLTLVRAIQIKRRSNDHTLTHILMRDGVMYFGVINVALLSNVISLLYGSGLIRGIAGTMTNILASLLVSRLMFNLREPRERSETAVTTTDASSIPMTTLLSHELTNIEEVGEDGFQESRKHRESSRIDSITELESHLRARQVIYDA